MKKPLLSEMTLREKIGQTAVSYCDNDMKHPEHTQWGSVYVTGGMRFKEFNARFDAKPDKGAHYLDWVKLMEDVNPTFKAPILAVTDNAVGLCGVLNGFDKLTTSALIGAADDEELAYKAGRARALQMRLAGIKWWWGPVVDVPAWKEPIMSCRPFSMDKDRIIRLAKAMAKGSMDAGVAPCAKHFPGEDGIEYRDGHITTMVNYMSLEEWEEVHGKIYREMIADGIPSIMTAHTAFPAIDDSLVGGNYRPASISYKIVTEFLKGELGFKGAVVTDGLTMRGLSASLGDSMARVYIEAFKAGNDFMLGCMGFYIDCIEKAVLDGEISMERVDDACRRALDLKEKLGMFEDDFKVAEGDFDEVSRFCIETNREIANKGIHLQCDNMNLIPVKKENIKKAAIIYFCPNASVRAEYEAVKNALEKRGAEVTVFETLTSRDQMAQIGKEYDLIVYLAHYGVNGTFVDPEYRAFYYALLAGSEKSVVINTSDHTMYYEFFTKFPCFINTFSAEKTVLEEAVAKIYGESEFTGICPFPVYPPKVWEFLKDKPFKMF